MTVVSSTKAPRHAIRSILQRLRNNIPLAGGDTSAPVRKFVLDKSRRTTSGAEFAKNYDQLLHDLQERQRLLKIDTGAENKLSPKEMSRRAAARAGLALPDLYPDLEK
mmetsp:Transcript_27538/g.40684  ORF Transcript_27538/g.40684 Transcript_27538/m.40684 type:complete len:108 (+) Transcript_27538:115-438(+)|eukprot:CAMPEP_0194212872 /NCGR_PEP_ID=MMETSP0156-20130528/13025_1 /TAXON_ID=33649 /ORGANISM="Thalassionema nitzschioides, Strain L26-B" /LENGTH=107 /DNA_ID=CAMNT_0038940767 /DNA_START=45 /DNA_END=368 /DNA_ORIENTATION=-